MRRTLRWLNVAIALVTLASGLAVLFSDLLIPGYRAHHRDALWVVVAYCALQVLMVVEFARDGRLVPWLAVAKALAAYLFLATFVVIWPYYRVWTPARYVYQLFDWGEGARIGLFALVFLGRGAFNTLNAMHFTEMWWGPLRVRRPLAGRLFTALPMTAAVLSVWAFVHLVREEARTFSAEAAAVARVVYESLDCEAVRTKAGQTATDIRQRGDQHFEVRIIYNCAETRVVVRAEDGRIGTAAGPQIECCAIGS